MHIEFDKKQTQRILNKLAKLSNNPVNMSTTMGVAAKMVQGEAKTLAPTNNGRLRESILVSYNNKSAKVYTNLSYAPYVEFGTGSVGNGTYKYKIKGVNLKYCNYSWVYPLETGDGTKFIYTNGQVAQPYMYPALSRNKKRIRGLFEQELRKSVKGKKGN